MKQLIKISLLIILVFSFPLSAFSEEWGEDGRSVGDMLEKDETNDEEVERDTDDLEREIDDESLNSQLEGDEEEEEDILPGPQEQSVLWMLFQMVLALAVVLFLIYALLKFINKRSKNLGGHSSIERVGGVSLGTNKSVQIVRIANKLYIVGVGDSIQLIKEITDDAEVEKILADHVPEQAFDQSVLKTTKWMKDRFSNKKMSAQNNDSFELLLNRELNEVKDSQKKAHTVLKEKDHD